MLPATTLGTTEVAGKFGKADEWIFWLRAARMPRIRS
jgi:hypothetical protein